MQGFDCSDDPAKCEYKRECRRAPEPLLRQRLQTWIHLAFLAGDRNCGKKRARPPAPLAFEPWLLLCSSETNLTVAYISAMAGQALNMQCMSGSAGRYAPRAAKEQAFRQQPGRTRAAQPAGAHGYGTFMLGVPHPVGYRERYFVSRSEADIPLVAGGAAALQRRAEKTSLNSRLLQTSRAERLTQCQQAAAVDEGKRPCCAVDSYRLLREHASNESARGRSSSALRLHSTFGTLPHSAGLTCCVLPVQLLPAQMRQRRTRHSRLCCARASVTSPCECLAAMHKTSRAFPSGDPVMLACRLHGCHA